MKRLENSALPRSRPIGGMRRSPTNDDTILPKAAPMITPIARSTTLPRRMNCLNSLSIIPPHLLSPRLTARSERFGSNRGPLPRGERENSVRLPPEERGHVEVLFRRDIALGPDLGRHAPPPVLGGRRPGPSRAPHLDHLARGLVILLT